MVLDAGAGMGLPSALGGRPRSQPWGFPVFTKRIFVGVILTNVFFIGAAGAVRLWAARHSTHDGIDGVVGRAALVVV